MKFNIFQVPLTKLAAMENKFDQVGLKPIHNRQKDGWESTFYFSDADKIEIRIPWIQAFPHIFNDPDVSNNMYYGAYVFKNDQYAFVLSFGKAHFYIRSFAEYNFGIEVAKRIVNEHETKQTSAKRLTGKQTKQIKSLKNTRFAIESGEVLDALHASILTEYKERFGKTGKFGSSALITMDITKASIEDHLTNLVQILEEMPPLFKIPRTTKLTREDNELLYNKCDKQLINSIKVGDQGSSFTSDSYDTVGVDFVFAGASEKYRMWYQGSSSELSEDLSVEMLREFIQAKNIPEEGILDIRIERQRDDSKPWRRPLKEALDYTLPDEEENVILSQGQWLQFNEDYIEQLNEYVDSIDREDVEDEFKIIDKPESDTRRPENPGFNECEEVRQRGYVLADKDFSRIVVHGAPSIEAWDLAKDTAVYAVKFGKAQRLSYVCQQAINTLEIIRNKANIKKLNTPIESYCLWLGYEAKNVPDKLSDINSVILKQSIETWARKCNELGIRPAIKISRKISSSKNVV